MHLDADGVDMSLGGRPAKIFMSLLMSFYKQNAGPNFITITARDKSSNAYEITIRNCPEGVTPADRICELEAKVKKLEQEIQDYREGLLGINT